MAGDTERTHENTPFRARFARLVRWQNVELSSADVRRLLLPGQEPLLWRALEGGCRTVGDLLDQSETSVLRWRSVGVGKAARIGEMLQTLELGMGELDEFPMPRADSSSAAAIGAEPDRQLESMVRRLAFDFDFDSAPHASEAAQAFDNEVESAIDLICRWSATIGGASSRREALTRALNATSVPMDVADALDVLGDATPELDEFASLDTVLLDLGLADPRSRNILLGRVVSPEPVGLQSLGDDYGVSRERIRQIEVKVRAAAFSAYSDAGAMRVVRWLGHALRDELGAFAPIEAARAVAPHLDPQLIWLALHMEGYELSESYALASGFRLPMDHELEIDGGVVDLVDLVSQLESLGVKEQFLDLAIGAIPGFEWVDEALVTKSNNFVDRAVIVLNQLGEPIDVEELRQRAAPAASSRGFRQRIFEDERFVRTSRNVVALAIWGHEAYTTVSEAMSAAVQAGPWELDDLAEDLSERFGVSPNSVRMYASAPLFRVRDGMLELRPPDDPYVPRDALASVQGLFGDPGDGRWRWTVNVDKDLLRGSGRTAPSELALAAGLSPGGQAVLVCDDLAVGLTWPINSHMGPRIGSLRGVAERLGCELGDELNLTVSVSTKSISANVIRHDEVIGAKQFRILTGVHPSDLGGLRRVLNCADGEVAALLKRGDGRLADVVVQAMQQP